MAFRWKNDGAVVRDKQDVRDAAVLGTDAAEAYFATGICRSLPAGHDE